MSARRCLWPLCDQDTPPGVYHPDCTRLVVEAQNARYDRTGIYADHRPLTVADAEAVTT